MAHSERIKYLLRKYFHDQCSINEREELMLWMQSPANQRDLEKYLQEHWLELQNDLPASDISYDQVWQKLQQNIPDSPATNKYKIWYKIAAGILTLITVTALLIILFYNNTPAPEFAMKTFFNPKGERTQVDLPDGSIVWLNAESRITYPAEFYQDTRKVLLSGEAYFDVVKADKPFVVETENAEIQVLGTSFNVSAYPEDDNFSTTLVEGEVLLKVGKGFFGKSEAKLKAHQRANYSKADKELALEEVSDLSIYTSWKDGKLVFANTKFSAVATKLERWFDKEIELLNNISDERFTGTFESESLEQILEVVNVSTPIDYSISGNKVLIKMKK